MTTIRTRGLLALIATTMLIGAAPAALAQESQVSASGPMQAPDDTLGLAPTAKIVASWPRISLLQKQSGTGQPVPRAKFRQAPIAPGAGGGAQPLPTSGVELDGVAAKPQSPLQRLAKSTPFPRPGQEITLSGLESSDTDGQITAYKWRAQYVADGTPTVVASADPVFRVKTAADTTQVDATLTVTDNDGRESVAAVTVRVVPNLPPVVELHRIRQLAKCSVTATRQFPTGQPTFQTLPAAPLPPQLHIDWDHMSALGGHPVSLYANGCDPDGAVTRYEFEKVSGGKENPGVVVGGADSWSPVPSRGEPEGYYPSDEAQGFAEYKVTAYDDEGATATSTLKFPVVSPCKPEQRVASRLLVTPLTACVEAIEYYDTNGKKVSDPKKAVREQVPIGSTGGSFRVNGIEFTVAPVKSDQKAGFVSCENKTYTCLISLDAAGAITGLSAAGARLDLPGGKVEWRINALNGTMTGLNAKGATLGGLPVTSIENFRLNAGQLGVVATASTFRGEVLAEAPAEFNGSTASQARTWIATRKGVATAAGTVPAFEIGPQDLEIGGVGIQNAHLKFDGDDLWEVSGDFLLNEPIPLGVKISASAGILNGGLYYLDVGTDFPNPGLQVPGTGVSIDNLRFTLDYGKGIETICVPRIGKKKLDLKPIRDLFKLFGNYSDDELYKVFPDYELDYGVPKFQACGQVSFFTAAKVFDKTLAEGTLGVGIADYDDYSVFRIVGKPMKLIGIPSELLFELYNDGYIHLNASAKASFHGGDFSAKAEFDFAARGKKFNAQAGAEVCVNVMDIGCASAQALLSSRGVAACLTIDVAWFEFSPGASYVYGGAFTPYLDGCSIGDVKVSVKATGGPTQTKLPPPGTTRALAAQRDRIGSRFDPGETATLTVDPGSTGAVFAVEGLKSATSVAAGRFPANNLASFQLTAPNGTVIDIDATPSNRRILHPIDSSQAGEVGYRVMRSPVDGVTNVLIPKAASGDWKVTITGKRPAAKVRVGLGVPRPKAAAHVLPAGSKRVINPKFFDRREGIVARVVDRGATGMSVIGQFKLKPGATTRPGALRFQPNSVKPEPRVVEVFFERNGLPVGYEQLDTYMSSAPPAPPAPRGVEVRTSGSRLQVRWDRMTGVSKYEVAVTTNDGRRLSFTTRANGLIEKMPFERWDAVKVQVRAVSRLGRRGAASTDLIKARAPKPRVRFTPAQVKALNRLPRA